MINCNNFFVAKIDIWLLACSSQLVRSSNELQRPHIIFILADDLGWNDVSFHGSAQIPTPNIDALAYSGLILNRYYVTPTCTPSRSALMTGKYPIHTGMHHTVLYAAEPHELPLNERILPQYLKDLGYTNHCVGKWHLGHYKKEYTPLHRGFDSHVGYWTGHHDYFDHIAFEHQAWGVDMRRDMDVAHDLHGQYTTDVITNESVKMLFERGANVNHRNTNGHTPVKYAGSKNHKELLAHLLDVGGDPNVRDHIGDSPLHRIASMEHHDCFHILLTHPKSGQSIAVNAQNNQGNTALHLACENDDATSVLLLIDHGASIDIQNKAKETPLDLCKPPLRRKLQEKLNISRS